MHEKMYLKGTSLYELSTELSAWLNGTILVELQAILLLFHILPACSEVRFSRVMSLLSYSRTCNTTQLVFWTEWLWGVTCCNTGCPSTHWPHTLTHQSTYTHKPMISVHCQCVPGWHKQTQMVTILVRDQT